MAFGAARPLATPAPSDSEDGQYSIKATFLCNFAKYFQWPQGAIGPRFEIGVVGKDPFGSYLDEVARYNAVGGKRVLIRRFRAVKDVKPCPILFLASSEERDLKGLVARTKGWPVLLVGDAPGFAQRGVAVNFYIQDGKVRFEVNRKAVTAHRLRMSSRLLLAGGAGEYAVKAAFLNNFAQYVQWPATAVGRRFLIGVVGEDPFGSFLDDVARSNTVGGKGITVLRFASAEDVKPCQILFLALADEEQVKAVVERVERWPVLLVGDSPGLAQKGAAVNFYIQEGKVRFEVNRKALSAHRLRMSANLLRLARIVD